MSIYLIIYITGIVGVLIAPKFSPFLKKEIVTDSDSVLEWVLISFTWPIIIPALIIFIPAMLLGKWYKL